MSDQPVVVRLREEPQLSAWLLTSENLDEVAEWCGGHVAGRGTSRVQVYVPTDPDSYKTDGFVWAVPGEYVVRGVTGYHFVVDAEQYEHDYEEVGRSGRPSCGRCDHAVAVHNAGGCRECGCSLPHGGH